MSIGVSTSTKPWASIATAQRARSPAPAAAGCAAAAAGAGRGSGAGAAASRRRRPRSSIGNGGGSDWLSTSSGGRRDLDLAGRQIGVDGALGPGPDRARRPGARTRRATRWTSAPADRVGVDDHLHEAGGVAQVEEHHAAVVAARGRPSRTARPSRRRRSGRTSPARCVRITGCLPLVDPSSVDRSLTVAASLAAQPRHQARRASTSTCSPGRAGPSPRPRRARPRVGPSITA